MSEKHQIRLATKYIAIAREALTLSEKQLMETIASLQQQHAVVTKQIIELDLIYSQLKEKEE